MTSTKLKVTGIDLFSAGDFRAATVAKRSCCRTRPPASTRKLVIKDNRLEGAVLYGDTIDGAWYFQLMREGTDISGIREELLFGQAHLGDSGHGGQTNAAAMSDDDEVCGCNGVCKGEIVKAITGKACSPWTRCKLHTKAAASCGSCTGLVEQILAEHPGRRLFGTPEGSRCAHAPTTPTTRCATAIRSRQSRAPSPTVFKPLEWREPDGCAPAGRHSTTT